MNDNITFTENKKEESTESQTLEISKLSTNPTISQPPPEIPKKENYFSKLSRRILQTVSKTESTITNEGKSTPQNYISNKIDNQKYNIFTLLPLFFFNEYKHFSNFYFLLIALTQIYEPFRIGKLKRLPNNLHRPNSPRRRSLPNKRTLGRNKKKTKRQKTKQRALQVT